MSLNQYLHCANTEIREDVAEFLGSVDLTRGVTIHHCPMIHGNW